MDTLKPPFKWLLKQTDLLMNLNDVFCLLWIPKQMDLLLHIDTVRILCFVCYGCLKRWDLLLYTDTVVMYMYQTLKTIDELYYICVGDARRRDSWCDISLKCVYVSICIYIVPVL